MPNVFRDLVDVLLDTEEFFKQAEGRGKGSALLYFGFISLVSLGVNLLLLWRGITPAGLIPFEKILGGSWGLALYVPLTYFVMGFFFASAYALILGKVLGRMGIGTGKGGSFNAVMYGFTPSILTLWIPVLGVLLTGWSLYLTAMGLGVYNSAPLKRNAKACVGAGIAVAVMIMVFMFGAGAYMIEALGLEKNLLWSVLMTF